MAPAAEMQDPAADAAGAQAVPGTPPTPCTPTSIQESEGLKRRIKVCGAENLEGKGQGGGNRCAPSPRGRQDDSAAGQKGIPPPPTSAARESPAQDQRDKCMQLEGEKDIR